MARDFTVGVFRSLLDNLVRSGYSFQTLRDYLKAPAKRVIILRHDVDRMPYNSLATARIENELGISGTYYFRITKNSFKTDIITEISNLGHEVGYHYEDLSRISCNVLLFNPGINTERMHGFIRKAAISFKVNLEMFRKYSTIETICMHGAPMSRLDSRLIWMDNDYRDLGILGEPYFDMNFEEVLYLTDTGRCWNGKNVSLRDKGLKYNPFDKERYSMWKVKPLIGSALHMTERGEAFQAGFSYKSTSELIKAVKNSSLPTRIMVTVHPQRWNDSLTLWMKELFAQRAKNSIKYVVVKSTRRDKSFK